MDPTTVDPFELPSAVFINGRKVLMGGGGGVAPITGTPPFTITLTPQESPSENYDLTIWPGTINNLLPTGLLNVVSYTKDSTVYVKIHCLTNGTGLTSASIVIDTSPSTITSATASAAPTSFDILLGVVTKNSVYQITTGNKTATAIQVITQEKASPTPGLSPYVWWWSWSVA